MKNLGTVSPTNKIRFGNYINHPKSDIYLAQAISSPLRNCVMKNLFELSYQKICHGIVHEKMGLSASEKEPGENADETDFSTALSPRALQGRILRFCIDYINLPTKASTKYPHQKKLILEVKVFYVV